MIRLLDTTLWIDLTRAKSPPFLKAFVAPYILDPDAHLAEPIIYEMLRFASDDEEKLLGVYFSTIPNLVTPIDLWTRSAELGRACRRSGYTPGGIDLLIAQVAIHYDVELVTFDSDFTCIASVSRLKVNLLKRPTS